MWSHIILFPDNFQATKKQTNKQAKPKAKEVWFYQEKFFFLSGMVVSGLTSVVLPTIEKRFQFSSKEAGFIAASNDISAILLTSFVSFYGGYGNKPKWLGCGALLTGTCNKHTFMFKDGLNSIY